MDVPGRSLRPRIQTDIHCVTKWSKLDTTWQGVTFDNLSRIPQIS
jgi:hypothetical protein